MMKSIRGKGGFPLFAFGALFAALLLASAPSDASACAYTVQFGNWDGKGTMGFNAQVTDVTQIYPGTNYLNSRYTVKGQSWGGSKSQQVNVKGAAATSAAVVGNYYFTLTQPTSTMSLKMYYTDSNWSHFFNNYANKDTMVSWYMTGSKFGATGWQSADRNSMVKLDGTVKKGADGWLVEFSNLPAGTYHLYTAYQVGALDWEAFRLGSTGMAIEFAGASSDAPLPGALVLLGTALAGGGVFARRRAKKSATTS